MSLLGEPKLGDSARITKISSLRGMRQPPRAGEKRLSADGVIAVMP
jgi:hypothetical protein